MYLPQQFNNPTYALDLIRENPFATLISNDDEGYPYISYLPLHLEERHSGLFIRGHCARANPHWKYLNLRPKVLISFMGPQAYMSPRVYPDLVRVPTWNYIAVQVKANARILEGEQAKDALLKQLISDHEPEYALQWKNLQPTYQQQMLNAIVAFELEVYDIKSKFKLNQHRPEAHQKMYEIYRNGTTQEQSLADWMKRIGMMDKALSTK